MTLGSFGALVSEWHVTRKRRVVEMVDGREKWIELWDSGTLVT